MLLVPIQAVLSARAISYTQTDSVDSVVTLALNHAKSFLSEALSVDFSVGDRLDIFSPPVSAVQRCTYRYLLSSGLIDEGSLVLRRSNAGEEIRLATDGETIDAIDFNEYAAEGAFEVIVRVPSGRHTLSAQYGHGFPEGPDGVALNLPSWVGEAAICFANHYLTVTAPVPTAKKDKGLAGYAAAQFEEGRRIIAPHYRARNMRIFSSRTVIL